MQIKSQTQAFADVLIELATVLNFVAALPQSSVMAAMQTTAINATRRAYSTSDAPRSSSKRARSPVARNSSAVVISVMLPLWWFWGDDRPHGGELASCQKNYRRAKGASP